MQNDDKKKKNDLDVSLEVGYKTEQVVDNGDVTEVLYSPTKFNKEPISRELTFEGETYTAVTSIIPAYDTKTTLTKLREVYTNSGNSIDAAYEYLKESITENPENLKYLISDLSCSMLKLYDSDKDHKSVGATAKDMLNNILQSKEGEKLDGFACMGIHEFGMKLLHDCNVLAVILSGYATENHATLLYKSNDGKYVYDNYGLSMEMEAPSLIDAIKTVYKKGGIESSGYVSIIDENSSYQKYAFEQEALWANELDKMDYNKTSAFDSHIRTGKNDVSGKIEVSNLGNIEAVVTRTLYNNSTNKPRETSISLGYKNNGETALFDKSQAVGIKLERNGENYKDNGNKTFFESKFVAEYIKGENNLTDTVGAEIKLPLTSDVKIYNKEGVDVTDSLVITYKNEVDVYANYMDKPIQKSNNITTFFHGLFGKQNVLVNNNTTKLENITQASLTGGITICKAKDASSVGAFGDARVVIEDGVRLTNTGKNWQTQNGVSVGYVGDLKLTTGAQTGGIQSGVKLNAATSFVANPNNNTTVGADAEGHSVILKPYQDYGASASVFASHKFAPDKMVYGKAIFEKDVQNLLIGGFSEKSYDKTTFGASVGAKVKNKDFHVTFKKSINNQNRTYDNSTVAIGANIAF